MSKNSEIVEGDTVRNDSVRTTTENYENFHTQQTKINKRNNLNTENLLILTLLSSSLSVVINRRFGEEGILVIRKKRG